MSGIGSFIIGLIAVAVVVALLIWALSWLYHRSSKEISFVRTGLGGQTVVGRQQVGDLGWTAYFKDVAGNSLGLWQSA